MFAYIRRLAFLAAAMLAVPAAAHEIQPAIADLTLSGEAARMDLAFNAEVFLAGIDVDGVADTNETEGSDDYDALRALAPDQIAERLRGAFPGTADVLYLETGTGAVVPFAIDTVDVPEVGNTDLARMTTLGLTADLPDGVQTAALAWPEGWGELILRQQGVEEPFTGLVGPGETSPQIPVAGGLQQTGLVAFLSYIPVGFDHILPLGLDHILFVLGLFLLAPGVRPLLWQVTAFTAAHTVTLALGALGIVTIPGSIVEPIIAASIVYVAVENIFTDGLNPWRPVIIFVFGLLHGLGFASVLGEFGLPEGQFIPALLGFNIGVEIGQLTVIAVAFLIAWATIRLSEFGEVNRVQAIVYLAAALVLVPLALIPVAAMGGEMAEALPPLLVTIAILAGLCGAASAAGGVGVYRRMVEMPASFLIALVGAYWCVERVFL
ncbi:HupE/UreJ family protein [Mesobacterium pallidum]|uniref:HupE/UreJ family protein n=1 Tax=Mesobacterium pallidum TaxID=2872037 RepID=UPI001EE29206|nr:HupE/UreJ family protein [Mesobacterium pallidum]